MRELQTELKAEKYSKFPDVRIFEIRKPVNKVYTEKFENIFHAIAQLDVGTISIKRRKGQGWLAVGSGRCDDIFVGLAHGTVDDIGSADQSPF